MAKFKQKLEDNIIMAETILRNAHNMCGVKFAQIPTSLMGVDHSYQRKKQRFVGKISDNWDIYKARAIEVSYRDGTFWVVDGQNRYLAAQNIGVEFLPCIIHENLSIKDEALLFAQQDNFKAKVNLFHKFKAELMAQDPVAMGIQALCSKYSIDTRQAAASVPGHLKALFITKQLYSQHGKKCVDWVFYMINAIGWHYERGGYGQAPVWALGYIYNKFSKNEKMLNLCEKALVESFKGVSPAFAVASARMEHQGSAGRKALSLQMYYAIKKYQHKNN